MQAADIPGHGHIAGEPWSQDLEQKLGLAGRIFHLHVGAQGNVPKIKLSLLSHKIFFHRN